jgi:hypothetical protein
MSSKIAIGERVRVTNAGSPRAQRLVGRVGVLRDTALRMSLGMRYRVMFDDNTEAWVSGVELETPEPSSEV